MRQLLKKSKSFFLFLAGLLVLVLPKINFSKPLPCLGCVSSRFKHRFPAQVLEKYTVKYLYNSPHSSSAADSSWQWFLRGGAVPVSSRRCAELPSGCPKMALKEPKREGNAARVPLSSASSSWLRKGVPGIWESRFRAYYAFFIVSGVTMPGLHCEGTFSSALCCFQSRSLKQSGRAGGSRCWGGKSSAGRCSHLPISTAADTCTAGNSSPGSSHFGS